MRGMPELYSGDELAMTGGEDPDNRHDFPGGSPTSTYNAFLASGRTPQQQHAFTTLQSLLTLRRLHPSLQTGEQQTLRADKNLFVFARVLDKSEHVLVAINKGRTSEEVTVNTDETVISGLQRAKQLRGDPRSFSIGPHTLTLRLAPESAIILQLR
jgi:glycosidase